MSIPYNELFPFLEKFIKKGKVRFLGGGVIVVEDKLENLLLLIEKLEEIGIPVIDRLSTYYLRRGSILSKPVRLYISERIAVLVPGN